MSGAVRVGVLGLRRGAALARLSRQAGMQLVAVCERDDRRREAATAPGAVAYRDVEPFLEHEMDAVILVNDFDQHALVAIRALDRGLSVLSETAACRTVAEGVALVEAAERSGGVYMFAETYPSMPLTREMRRRYQAGDIGEVRYAEAEYLDEPADLTSMASDRAHWRARTPATYYCTHSLAPVAAITGTRPVQVSAFVVPTAAGPEALERARRGRGWAALLAVRLDNGAVLKSLHGFLEAGQQAWVRLHGDRGLMENLRHGDTRTLRVVWDAEDGQDGRRAEEVYLPWPPEFPVRHPRPASPRHPPRPRHRRLVPRPPGALAPRAGLGRKCGDGVDRDQQPARELDVGRGGTRRRGVGHVSGVDVVESREVVDVGVEDRHRHQIGHRRPGGFEDGREVPERLVGLGLDPVGHGTRPGVDPRGP